MPSYPPCISEACSGKGCAGLFPKGTKVVWPELVGVKQQVAKNIINKTNPYVTVIPLYPGFLPLANLCVNRVWLYVDGHNGKVTRVPMVG